MRFLVPLFLAATLYGQPGGKSKQAANPLAGKPEAIETGKELFAGVCSACHGPNGEGGHGPSLADNRQVRRASDQELFTVIRRGVPGTEMPPFALPDETIWRMAAFLRSLSQPAIHSRLSGDPTAGRDIFYKKGGCASCHMIRGQGGFPGPDLTDIGATRTVRQLREALLQPNARIHPDFRAVSAVTNDGREIQGVAKSYTNYSVGILDAHGELHLLATQDLKKIAFREKSLMPDDYGRRLTPSEVESLLAFLSRQSLASLESIADRTPQ